MALWEIYTEVYHIKCNAMNHAMNQRDTKSAIFQRVHDGFLCMRIGVELIFS